MSFSNDCGTLHFHKQSLKGAVQDYVINFHKDETDIEAVIDDASALFLELMNTFSDSIVMARLVAKIHFSHFGKEKVEDRFFHFTSYSMEVVDNPEEFFKRHMIKIAERLNAFNHHGSSLVIEAISDIHIQLSTKKN